MFTFTAPLRLNRFSLHSNMVCYLHFKFNHLLFFEKIIYNECLDKIWIQIVHYYFRSINLEQIKVVFRTRLKFFVHNFKHVVYAWKISSNFYFPCLLKIQRGFDKTFTTNVCHKNLIFLEILKKYLSFIN